MTHATGAATVGDVPRTNRSRYAVLGALCLGPRTGYEIKRDLEQTVGNFWTESFGQIYPILRKLLEGGEVEVNEDDVGGRQRKVYSITPAGREAFVAWMQEPPASVQVRNELLLKLFFGPLSSPAVAKAHLERARSEAEARIEVLGPLEAELEKLGRDDELYPYGLITVRAGLTAHRARVAWCIESLALIESAQSS